MSPMLVALAAVAGALAAWAGVIVTVLMVLWNKLDKRFDDLETRWDKRFEELEARQDKRFEELEARQDKRFGAFEARQDKRFDELKTEMQEGRAETKALREALLSIKALSV